MASERSVASVTGWNSGTPLAPTETGQVEHRATIRDIARLAGVSIATVSRVLNNRPDVSPETRALVLRHLRARGYTTHHSAHALAAGRTGFIAFTMPPLFARHFAGHFATILAGALEAAAEHDTSVAVRATFAGVGEFAPLCDRLMDGTNDGAVLLLPEETVDELETMHERRFPFVVADPRTQLPTGVPAVSAAHRAGATAATEHLLALGHRRIAHISGPRGWAATEERIEGFATALAAAGALPAAAPVVEGDFSSRSGYEAAIELLGGPAPPTAILAANDHMAFGVLQAAAERGVAVPEDLSVIGFDDAELARMATPALTTVRQPLAELGRTSVSLLMRMIDGQRVESLRVELATQLLVRESTGPAPAG